VGYKLHLDVAGGDVPVSAILTSALIAMTSQRITYLYDIMDAAYDAAAVDEYSRRLGHQPIIVARSDRHAPGRKAERKRLARLGFDTPEDRLARYRSAAERVIARLKDDLGARMVRVHGHAKVYCHLMFGVLSLTALNLFRLATAR